MPPKVALAWRANFDPSLALETLSGAIHAIKMLCLRMAPAS